MTEERDRRVARNEALYRQVNERIEDVNDAFGVATGEFAVFCECGDVECMEQIVLERAKYEEVRRTSIRFIVRPHHDDPDAEHPVERHEDYWVLEKEEGLPADVAHDLSDRGEKDPGGAR